jgi:hypothetical protein
MLVQVEIAETANSFAVPGEDHLFHVHVYVNVNRVTRFELSEGAPFLAENLRFVKQAFQLSIDPEIKKVVVVLTCLALDEFLHQHLQYLYQNMVINVCVCLCLSVFARMLGNNCHVTYAWIHVNDTCEEFREMRVK